MSSTTSVLPLPSARIAANTMKPLQRVLSTTDSLAPTLARLTLGLVMFPHGAQKGEGFEYHLLALGLAVIVMIYGGGKASLDARLARVRS